MGASVNTWLRGILEVWRDRRARGPRGPFTQNSVNGGEREGGGDDDKRISRRTCKKERQLWGFYHFQKRAFFNYLTSVSAMNHPS